MSSILASQFAFVCELKCGVSANLYSCVQRAEINFGDLAPYLTNAFHYTPQRPLLSLYLSGKLQIIPVRPAKLRFIRCGARKNILYPDPDWYRTVFGKKIGIRVLNLQYNCEKKFQQASLKIPSCTFFSSFII